MVDLRDTREAQQFARAGLKILPGCREEQAQPSGQAQAASAPGREAWPEPQPLPDGLPPVQPFNSGLLPDQLRPWVEDIADRMQCPPDFAAAGAMVAAGAVIGRQIAIRPRRYDDWAVVPNLWGAVVGRPGLLKTPSLAAVVEPVVELERAAKLDHEQAVIEWEADALIAQQAKKLNADKIKAALKKDDGEAAKLVARAATRESETSEPARRRYLTSDPTIEKLGEILQSNPRGILISRDELIGFLRSLERDGAIEHSSSRPGMAMAGLPGTASGAAPSMLRQCAARSSARSHPAR